MSSSRRPAASAAGPDAEAGTEFCRACGAVTPHEVGIEIVSTATDRPDEDHRKFARRPARVTTCRRCGATTRAAVAR